MKINPHVIRRNIAGENVLIPIGRSATDTDGLFMLSEVAGRIWELIEDGQNRDSIIRTLQQEYDAPENQIAADYDEFIDDMVKCRLLFE
jgi:hypothetical protein